MRPVQVESGEVFSIPVRVTIEQSEFDTHQGVKGLEFPRVMIVADDGQMRMKSMHSYEKLFGVKALSQKDLENEKRPVTYSLNPHYFVILCFSGTRLQSAN